MKNYPFEIIWIYTIFFFFTNTECFPSVIWLNSISTLVCYLMPNSVIYIYSTSPSSCRALTMDISDILSPPIPIVHCLGQVFHYRHRAAVCMFELDVLPLLAPVKGSKVVHHLWVRPYFSCRVPRVWSSNIVFVTDGKQPYSCCFVGCCLQDLFNIVCSILV